jgi:hypothetical protein
VIVLPYRFGFGFTLSFLTSFSNGDVVEENDNFEVSLVMLRGLIIIETVEAVDGRADPKPVKLLFVVLVIEVKFEYVEEMESVRYKKGKKN